MKNVKKSTKNIYNTELLYCDINKNFSFLFSLGLQILVCYGNNIKCYVNNFFLEKIITLLKVIQKNDRVLKVVPKISIFTEKSADVSKLNENFE